MSFFEKIKKLQIKNKTKLCLGLDPRLPDAKDLTAWGENLIKLLKNDICSIKPNYAFYLAEGEKGIKSLAETINFAKKLEIPVILDAKMGDIGSTAEAYAKFAFDYLKADAITLNPYMGIDSIKPFLEYKESGVFILCRTSNPSGADFEELKTDDGKMVYEHIAYKAKLWGENAGLVVGATEPLAILNTRKQNNDAWLLLPGVGAQGGSVQETCKAARHNMIIPVSRGIANAIDPLKAAQELNMEINKWID